MSTTIAQAVATTATTPIKQNNDVQITTTASGSTSAVSSVAQKVIASEQDICPICREKLIAKNYVKNPKKRLFTIHCGHMIHTSCISQMTKYECPSCREPMTKKEIDYLFQPKKAESIATALFYSSVTQEQSFYPPPLLQSLVDVNESISHVNAGHDCGCVLTVSTETLEATTCCWGCEDSYEPKTDRNTVVKPTDSACGGRCVLRALGGDVFVYTDCRGATRIDPRRPEE